MSLADLCQTILTSANRSSLQQQRRQGYCFANLKQRI